MSAHSPLIVKQLIDEYIEMVLLQDMAVSWGWRLWWCRKSEHRDIHKHVDDRKWGEEVKPNRASYRNWNMERERERDECWLMLRQNRSVSRHPKVLLAVSPPSCSHFSSTKYLQLNPLKHGLITWIINWHTKLHWNLVICGERAVSYMRMTVLILVSVSSLCKHFWLDC